MQVTVTARHFEMTEAIRNYAKDQVESLKKYSDQIISGNVILSVEKYRHKADISVHVYHQNFVGIAESNDIYISIDKAMEKIVKQIHKFKGKAFNSKNNRAELEAIGGGDEAETFEPALIERIKVFIKPMNENEAVEQIKLEKMNFLVFHNSDTDMVNVIYRRKDGHFSLIEAE